MNRLTNLLKTTLVGMMLLNVSVKSHAVEPTPAFATKIAHQFLLTDITTIGDRIFAVGERGHIIYSNDGANWQQANVPINVLLTSVTFVDDKTGVAVGHDATILRTTDGGQNWQLVNFQPELDRPFLKVASLHNSIVAVGAFGMYWHSTDGGANWQQKFQESLLSEDDQLYLEEIKEFEPENLESEMLYLLPHFNSIHLTDSKWLLVGDSGLYAESTDKGQTWSRQEVGYEGSFFSAATSAESTFLGGLRGTLMTKGADSNWQQVAIPVPATINSTLNIAKGQFLFANSGNLFFLSNDLQVKHHLFADGKALVSGVVLGDKLIIASENGIKSIPLSKIMSK